MELLWWLLEKTFGILVGLLLGELAAVVVGFSGPGGALLGLADDVLMIFLKEGLSTWEGFQLSILLLEIEKIVHESVIYADEDDEQRAARHAALVRWHGHKMYLFGDVSVGDFVRTAYSGYTVYQSPVGQSVSDWVADGWAAEAEGIAEIAVL